jgi:putative spermidine/putrescine transport system substrate-binding protein
MIRNLVTRLALAGAVSLGVVAATSADARDLTVTAWGGASQDVSRQIFFEPFMEETGINLVEDTWSGGIGVVRTKVHGGNPDWDVVSVEVEVLVLGCEEGLLEPMDWDMLGGKDAFIDAAVHDCGVGGEVWSVGMGWDGDRFAEGPQTWAEFWDVETFPGKRGMRSTPKYTLEIALMADGVASEEVYEVLSTPEGVDRAFNKLDELKPHITWWSTASQPPDLLASGEVAYSVATAGRLFAANDNEGKNFVFNWNGNLYAIDYWVVLKGSPNTENAMKFVAFASEPERQAQMPVLIALGATNKEAIALVDPNDAPNDPSSPEHLAQGIAINGDFWVENADQLNQRFSAWAAR